MDCQQYTEILHVYLDGELQELPQPAKAHAAICTDCMAMTRDLTAIRKATQFVQISELNEAAQANMIMHVQNRIIAKKGHKKHQFLSVLWRHIRWSRAFAAAAVVALLVYSYFAFEDYQQTQRVAALTAEEEIEILLEEHTWQMESGIFQTGTMPSRVMLTAASGRK